MATMKIFIVFVLPVIFSIFLGAAVLNGIVEQPGRELNMWQFGNGHSTPDALVGIIGLSEEYTTSEPVEIALQIAHPLFSCGDIYVTIYDTTSDTALVQNGFFDQCVSAPNILYPLEFSEVVEKPGSYELVVEIVSQDLDVINGRGLFTVK